MRFAILFTLIFNALFAQAAIRASFDYKQFIIPGEGVFLETHLNFQGKSLEWVAAEQDMNTASVQATLVVYDGDRVVDFRKVKINASPTPTGVVSDFIDIQRFVLPKGNYILEIALVDLNDPNLEEAKFSRPVEITLALEQPAVSSITFVEAYAKSTQITELTKSGLDILPLISDYFPEESNKLVFYAEAYYSNVAVREGDKYLLTYSIWNDQGEVPGTRKYMRKDLAPATPIIETVDISAIPSGRYQLVVEMRTPSNEEFASESIAFTRRAPLSLATLNQGDSYVAQPGLAFQNPDSMSAYVSWLHPIAQNNERNTILSQVQAGDQEVLQTYFLSFWNERAPEDPIGAWLKYVKEVWYVNRKYKTPVLDGYRTDRGRVFLQYGRPNTIVERHNQVNVFPYEIWHYYKIERFNDKRFLFYSRNVVNYDFDLLHSDMLGEIQNHDWPTLMRTKNNDLRPSDSAINRMNPRDTYSFDELEDLFYNPR